ncbi:alpha/beta family hydrolase [Dermatophilaceae bacterium Soc4.6]
MSSGQRPAGVGAASSQESPPPEVAVEVATPTGPARVHVRRPDRPRGLAVLGHGAGGGLRSVDLTAAVLALVAQGWTTALVEQPWLVAGRRIAGPPRTLDAAWVPVVHALRAPGAVLDGVLNGVLDGVPGPLLLAGRSAGARVACRTATLLHADAVLALSFPLHPPGRPERSRAFELALVLEAGLPIAVVQGEKDPFGGPAEVAAHLPAGCVHVVKATHTVPASSARAVGEAVAAFAGSVLGAAAHPGMAP